MPTFFKTALSLSLALSLFSAEASSHSQKKDHKEHAEHKETKEKKPSHKRREHAAHEHGKAELSLAIEGGSVVAELSLPMADLLGFEHKPDNAQELKKWDDAAALLATSDKVLKLDASAGCSLAPLSPLAKPWEAAETVHKDHEHKDHEHKDHEHGAEHKHKHKDHQHKHKDHQHGADKEDHKDHAHDEHFDVKLSYTFTCKEPAKLKQPEVKLFESLPTLKQISARFVTATSQGQKTLEPKSASLPLAL